MNFLSVPCLTGGKKTWWKLASGYSRTRARHLTCFLSASVTKKAIDSVLRHREVCRPKDLPAPPRIVNINMLCLILLYNYYADVMSTPAARLPQNAYIWGVRGRALKYVNWPLILGVIYLRLLIYLERREKTTDCKDVSYDHLDDSKDNHKIEVLSASFNYNLLLLKLKFIQKDWLTS